eukprot:710705-Pelagomonas_calceolata.AAC.1
MQLVLWRRACMGRWRGGVGSDEGGPGIEQMQGLYKASGGWCLWSGEGMAWHLSCRHYYGSKGCSTGLCLWSAAASSVETLIVLR